MSAGKGIKKAGKDRNEWYDCDVQDVKSAIEEIKTGIVVERERTQSFKMRPEQYRAVDRTIKYFNLAK